MSERKRLTPSTSTLLAHPTSSTTCIMTGGVKRPSRKSGTVQKRLYTAHSS